MQDDSFRDFVLDQLEGLGGVEFRQMFGAYGLYHEGTFFAIINKGQLFFKTDDESRQPYIDYGMKPFRTSSKQTLKTYYEVPVDIIEDRDQLVEWAKRAVASRK